MMRVGDSAFEPSTLVEILRWRAFDQPDRRAYTFLIDGEKEEVILTYSELDRRARAIGTWLQSVGAGGKRVLLLYPPGLEFIAAFFGSLYAAAVAIPAYPGRLARTLPRLQAIVADAQAEIALTTTGILSKLKRMFTPAPNLGALRWFTTDDIATGVETGWQEPAITGETLAFLQYTSGSTATPKGVMLSHRNVLSNSALIYRAFALTSKSVGVIWLPPYHDMGLIGGVVEPLYAGIPVTLMSPASFLQRPLRWLQAISRYRATVSGGPNFAYELCVRKIPPRERTGLELSQWQVAFTGAEPIREETLKRFAASFEPCGFRPEAFYPCYGLAEATLIVSGGPKAGPPVVHAVERGALVQNLIVGSKAEREGTCTLVACGQPIEDQRVVIVDPESLTRCSPNRVGEIWVSGSSVGLGYWNRVEETERTFRAHLADTGEGPFLRTGDLGFLHDGMLFVTGRLKDLIIIRGFNHHPQDIELTVERSHPALRPGSGAAFSLEVADEERLIVVHEVERSPELDVNGVIQAVRRAVADYHEVQVYAVVLVRPGSVPKTTSGKVQRYACRAAFLSGDLDVVGEWRAGIPSGGDVGRPSAAEGEAVSVPRKSPTAAAVEAWLLSHLSRQLAVDPGRLDIRQPFTSYGLDSSVAVSLAGELGDWLGRPISPTVAWNYPTVEVLANHLAGESIVSESRSDQQPTVMEPIAIIGLGCRFPGANDPDAFWRLLRDGVDAITEVPPTRWDANVFFHPDPATPGKTNTRWGGFLDQVDQFDPTFFGISPREATHMDPQQRLLLEVTWEALENAGLAPDRLAGSRTGVFIGIGGNDYSQLLCQFPDHTQTIETYTGTGNAHSIAANRLSYLLDLRGPSLAVDTACSSSLVAIHLACQSLRNGESDLAIAGGVNVILGPEVTIAFSKARMMASDGRCKTFDANADGYVRGEGCGIVILKRLSDALKHGDNVLALVRGSAVNQDGHTAGITAPSGPAQQAVIREALSNADVSPAQVSYIEAHGTGTSLGDPIEVQALAAVLGEGGPGAPPCALGSVKANIGHLETAAGVASVIKLVLCLMHEEIPPQLHLKQLNPQISLDGTRVVITTEARPWRAGAEPRIAGTSAFGFGGTNTHLVLQEAPPKRPADNAIERPLHLLSLSAKSESALTQLTRSYKAHLDTQPALELPDVCFTANTGRSHFAHRLAITADSTSQLRERLDAFVLAKKTSSMQSGHVRSGHRPKVAFLFTGQGAQYIWMARQLYETQPTFRGTLQRADDLLSAHLEVPLLSVLYPAPGQSSLLHRTAYTQPALFALECALAELWQSWGVTPDAVLGHSVGEYAAACVAGVFSFEEGLALVAERGRLMQALPQSGMMAAVFAGEARMAEAVACHATQVSIAAVNGPANAVISGAEEAVREVLRELESEGIVARPLTVSHAFHSPLMDPMLDAFERNASQLRYEAPRIPLVSNLTGRILERDGVPDVQYWRRHVREPVRFAAGMVSLAEQGCELFVEVGPNPTLIGMGKRCLPDVAGTWVPSLHEGQEDWLVLLDSLGTLYVSGVDVDWVGFDRDYLRHRVPLPTYPFQRQRYWIMPPAPGESREIRPRKHPTHHPLLGQRLRSAVPTFESELGTEALTYLSDHRVEGTIVLPASAHIEMALAAASEVFGPGLYALADVAFQKALFLPEDGSRAVQLVLSSELSNAAWFRVFSLTETAPQQQASWTLHVTGRVHTGNRPSPQAHISPEEIRTRCGEEISGTEFYEGLRACGLQYGPRLQGVRRVWRRNGEALGEIELPPELEPEVEVEAHQLHPVLLDACFHVLAAALPIDGTWTAGGATYLPTGMSSLSVYRRPDGRAYVYSHALIRSGAEPRAETVEGDLWLLDDTGEILAEVRGLCLQRLARIAPREENLNEWLYELRWQPKTWTAPEDLSRDVRSDRLGSWLIFADREGFGQTLGALLEARGERCVIVFPGEEYRAMEQRSYRINPAVPEQFRQLLNDAIGPDQPPCHGVVHLWSLDAPSPEEMDDTSLDTAQALGCGSVLHLIQALSRAGWPESPRLWLVTRGAQSVSAEPAPVAVTQSPLWGLGAVIALEHPEFRSVMVDLDPVANSDADRSLFKELFAEDHEDRIAVRRGVRYVARLVQGSWRAPAAPRSNQLSSRTPSALVRQSVRLEVLAPGRLDSLTLRPVPRREPAPGEVEIEVRAAGLNFDDVMKALGTYPGLSDGRVPLGLECAGTVVRLGKDVEGLQPGNEVIAVAPDSFGTFVTMAATLVVPKPSGISFEEAATIPVAFVTAYYALHHLARLNRGERVLIHAAAGAVGLAAVQLAQRAGAEIFATASSPEKRAFLESLGVKHVMNSRSLAFAEEVMGRTGGKGVDVVLSSLGAEFIAKSLSTLSAHGRFVELGKTDIHQDHQLRLRPFEKGQSYFAVDMDRMFRDRPVFSRSLFFELMEYFKDGALRPLPVRVVPIQDAVDAFRYMAQRKNIGRVVLSLGGVKRDPALETGGSLRSDGTYLITGGLGNLGLQVARWMVEEGARHVVLVSRRGAAPNVEATLNSLRMNGAQVLVIAADVAQKAQVSAVLDVIERSLPPLRGIVHAAGVLEDGVLLNLEWERFARVMAPKINGAWNLHTETLGKPLDFFVLFSSITSLLGTPGQGNYASANAFLDSLAHHRRALGLQTLSINWGPWTEAGMAARSERAARVELGAITPIAPKRAVKMLEWLLRQDTAQMAVMAADWQKLLRGWPAVYQPPLLAELVLKPTGLPVQTEPSRKQTLTREVLLALDPTRRRHALESHFQDQVAIVLGLDSSRIDVQQPLNTFGLDSLMAIELRNRVEAGLGAVLPMASVLENPSIAQLASEVLAQLTKPFSSLDLEKIALMLERVEQLSAEEARAMLGREKLSKRTEGLR